MKCANRYAEINPKRDKRNVIREKTNKEIAINGIIKTLSELEDYEHAEKLKIEWEQYKNKIDEKRIR